MGLCDNCKEGKETRECFIDGCGHCELCRDCAYKENLNIAASGGGGMYDFCAWIAEPCDDCSVPTAFKGKLLGYPDGVRCDTCSPGLDKSTGTIKWICEFCLVHKHTGHKFTSWGPSELDIFMRQVEGYI